MKKILSLVLIAITSLSLLAGCSSGADGTSSTDTENAQNDTQAAVTDTWDGSVANSFDGGDGSEASPYKIATAEQLAYLASEINSGKSYTGKHFALMADLDLAEVPWTPIGTNKHPFDGEFDGNGHTLSKLNIAPIHSIYVGTTEIGIAGLFGYATDATIASLSITDARFEIKEQRKYRTIKAGVLAANIDVYTKCNIRDIKVINASICTNKTPLPLNSGGSFYAGGVIGYCLIKQSAECSISNLHGEISIEMNDYMSSNMVGGIMGFFINQSSITISNLASYLSVKWAETGNEPAGSNMAGAIGTSQVLDNTKTKISNVYSEVITNKQSAKDIQASSLDDFYRISVIVGEASNSINSNATYELTNAFGYVKPSNSGADFTETYYTLYSTFKNETHTETNCKGCTELPDNHGFDTNIWDVSDPAKPVLK